MYSCGPQHMDVQKQDDQHKLTYSNYVRTQDVTLKTCRRWWMIGRSGERGSGISMLAARHNDDDIYTPDQLNAGTTLDVNLHFLSAVCDLKKKNAFTLGGWCYYTFTVTVSYVITREWWFRVYYLHAENFLAFDQIQLDAYRAVVWRRFEATFKLRPVIPVFERNEMTECPIKPRQNAQLLSFLSIVTAFEISMLTNVESYHPRPSVQLEVRYFFFDFNRNFGNC